MKILVCGGRAYSNFTKVCEELDRIHDHTPITVVVSGNASGADTLGEKWALQNRLLVYAYPADWTKNGKAAGPIRNQLMLDANPDLLLAVAFAGGRGTADMIRRAKSKCLTVIEVID